ncbi:MAG: MFS transporter [Bacteroidales bacterium]|nr:MFS transporter [Bacteroidales bacterium]
MKKPSLIFRWLVLFVVSLAMFGNYYLYDSIAPVADLLTSQLGFSAKNIGQLYSFYSYAAIVALIFGGIFIDRFGTSISIILFGTICSLAGVMTMISPDIRVMIVGRTLLGIGAEPLIVAITVAIAKWFKGKEIAFAMGINLFIARAGSFFADRSPSILKNFFVDWQQPLKIAAIIGILCFLASVVYYFQEKYGKKKYELSKAGETDKLSFKGLITYNKSYWLIVALCFTFYSTVFPFRSFAIIYFQDFHHLERSAAGNLLSFLPIAAMFATPLIGLLVDVIGKRASLMSLGAIMIMPVFLLMTYSSLNLHISISLLGVAFSLIPAIMWPAVAFVIEEKKLGKAYALMTLLQQAGVAGMNELIGRLNTFEGASAVNPGGYVPMMWVLSFFGILGLVFALWLRKIETGPKAHGLEKGTI